MGSFYIAFLPSSSIMAQTFIITLLFLSVIAQRDDFMSFAGEEVIQPRNIFRLSGSLSFQKMYCSYWSLLYYFIQFVLTFCCLHGELLRKKIVQSLSSLSLPSSCLLLALKAKAMAIHKPKEKTTDFLLGLSGLLQANLKKQSWQAI